MGYTHYWDTHGEIGQEDFRLIGSRVADFIRDSDIPVQYEHDDSRPPLISDDLIRFNGVGENGHETFYFERGGGWQFCKTAEKPYDELVVGALKIIRGIAPQVSLSSDGGDGVFD